MGKIAAIPLLFFVGLSAVVKAQAGVTTITDFTVLVEKKTSLWENFFFNVNDDTGEQYFCSTPFDVRLNSDGNRDESTVSDSLSDSHTHTHILFLPFMFLKTRKNRRIGLFSFSFRKTYFSVHGLLR